MAIEINSKSRNYKAALVLPNILGAFCLILALVLGGLYLFFSLNFEKINKSILEKENDSLALTQSILEKEIEIIPIKDKIVNFQFLISEHKSPINILAIIEKNCFPNVWFSDLEFNFKEMSASLSGHTDNLATVEQQFASIEKEPLLAEVSLSGISLLGGDEEEGEVMKEGVDFNLNLIFKPEVFDK